MDKTKSKKKIVLSMEPKKRGPGRPRKDVVINETEMSEGCGLPGMFQPSQYDVRDELERFSSYSEREYSE